jgi:hypothetical protein
MEMNGLAGEQLALISQVRDEWLEIGLNTAPVDRAQIRDILGRLYALANRPAPKHIIHLESPFQISNAIAVLSLEGRKLREPSLHFSAYLDVFDAVRDQFTAEIDGVVPDPVKEQVRPYLIDRTDGEPVSTYSNGTALLRNFLITEEIAARSDLQNRNRVTYQVSEPLGALIRAEVLNPGSQLIGINQACLALRVDFGQFDNSLWWFDLLGRLGISVSKLAPSFELSKSCGWAALFWDWAFISARPECIHLDDRGRLHCETGPALRYPDGFSVFAIHGDRVLRNTVVPLESITISGIESEANVEERRVMIERYGLEQYLVDAKAEEIHRDDFGILYRKGSIHDELLVMVKVVNSTPEPDGSFKDYFLRVPPTMERARQAVAWTFGKEEMDYAPAFQT